ncbi:helix-turn-helix transcriptional regulator [Nostoc sp. DedQUE07]|uniref:helix-turn-helix domain-containing protein n=1 Tax=Nostoc sp. DedQUE07 TaxID=3075392 RepID=UPI002AD44E51|nr:helix-turn-helix transcriptional regulator [Nostoc sp. DedQUE07]MDZ8129437.1 helix-turn-helix transcriptional regulator [Nostoc sp. DedQUE07]
MKHKRRMGYNLDTHLLAAMVKTKRGRKGLRDTAKEIGNVSSSTLSRVENGKMPDMETFLLLCNWLQVSPAELFKKIEESEALFDSNTPETIEIQLRASKKLDPAIANALAELVKAAYRDNSQQSDNQQPD